MTNSPRCNTVTPESNEPIKGHRHGFSRNGTERLARRRVSCVSGSYDGGAAVCAGPVCTTNCTTSSNISETCLRHTICYFRFRLLKSQDSLKRYCVAMHMAPTWSEQHMRAPHDDADVNAQISFPPLWNQLNGGTGKYTSASLGCIHMYLPPSLLIKLHL